MSEENPCYLAYLSAFDVIGRLRDSGRSLRPVNVINGLIPFLEEKLGEGSENGFSIELCPKKWVGTQIFGALLRYQNHAKIIYALDLTTCWRRFVVAKEISHLLFDDENSYTTDPALLVGALLSEIPFSDGPMAAVTSEQLAAVMAIELLLPHQERDHVEKLVRDGFSPLKIAMIYRVPAKIVEAFLSKEYMEMARACWDLRGANKTV